MVSIVKERQTAMLFELLFMIEVTAESVRQEDAIFSGRLTTEMDKANVSLQ